LRSATYSVLSPRQTTRCHHLDFGGIDFTELGAYAYPPSLSLFFPEPVESGFLFCHLAALFPPLLFGEGCILALCPVFVCPFLSMFGGLIVPPQINIRLAASSRTALSLLPVWGWAHDFFLALFLKKRGCFLRCFFFVPVLIYTLSSFRFAGYGVEFRSHW